MSAGAKPLTLVVSSRFGRPLQVDLPSDGKSWSRARNSVGDATVNVLGEDLLPYLVLAIGGGLLIGNLAALVRPPEKRQSETDLERAPLFRTLGMALIGLVASVWAIASLVS